MKCKSRVSCIDIKNFTVKYITETQLKQLYAFCCVLPITHPFIHPCERYGATLNYFFFLYTVYTKVDIIIKKTLQSYFIFDVTKNFFFLSHSHHQKPSLCMIVIVIVRLFWDQLSTVSHQIHMDGWWYGYNRTVCFVFLIVVVVVVLRFEKKITVKHSG